VVKAKVCEVKFGQNPDDSNSVEITFEAGQIPRGFLGDLITRINGSRYCLTGEGISLLKSFINSREIELIQFMQGVIIPIRRRIAELPQGRVKEGLQTILSQNDPAYKAENTKEENALAPPNVSKYLKPYFDALYSRGKIELTEKDHIGKARGIDAAMHLIREVREFAASAGISIKLRHTSQSKRLCVYLEGDPCLNSFREAYNRLKNK
jgi:hypothetical protein